MTIQDLLKTRYCPPEWAIFFEVANGTGARIRRYADAVAMNLFPSRGLEVHGFEIKTGRGDFLRELKDASKSSSVQKYCDRWWIVATEGVVKDNELPKTWGLLQANKDMDSLRIKVQAPVLEARPMDRSFVAAFLRRAAEQHEQYVKKDSIAVELRKNYDRGHADGKVMHDYELKSLHRDYDALKKKVDDFCKKTGVDINAWSYRDMSDEFKAFLHLREGMDYVGSLERAHKDATRTAEIINKALQEFANGK